MRIGRFIEVPPTAKVCDGRRICLMMRRCSGRICLRSCCALTKRMKAVAVCSARSIACCGVSEWAISWMNGSRPGSWRLGVIVAPMADAST
jgi:hypothetical protein